MPEPTEENTSSFGVVDKKADREVRPTGRRKRLPHLKLHFRRKGIGGSGNGRPLLKTQEGRPGGLPHWTEYTSGFRLGTC